MAHVRQQLRDAFKAALAGITGVEKVVGIRTDAFNPAELPAIQVVTASEDIGPFDQSAIETDRTILVEVSIWAQGGETVDDTIDTIAAAIETRIANATGGIWDAGGIILAFPSSATMTLGEMAEKTAVVLTTRYRVRLQASTPETIGD